jgi:hypothetical protein
MSTALLEEDVELSKPGGYLLEDSTHSSELPSATDLLGVENSSVPSREEMSVPPAPSKIPSLYYVVLALVIILASTLS